MEPDRLAARVALGISVEDTVIAILPGSRVSEIKYLADTFFRAAVEIRKRIPKIKFVVPAVPTLLGAVHESVAKSGLQGQILVVEGKSHLCLAACDVTLIASGTATLEAALFKRPMVIAYKMHSISWEIMRRKMLQPWVGLPNILCGQFVVPEFLQEKATPVALAEAVIAWIEQPNLVHKLETRFGQLHLDLNRNTTEIATNAIQTLLES